MTSELTSAWRALMEHAEAMRDFRVADAFRADPNRAERFSMRAAGLFVDFSKQRISAATLSHLHALADAAAVVAQRDAMAAGEHINRTEQRAVMHMALRNPAGGAGTAQPGARQYTVDGRDVGADVEAVLQQMSRVCDAVQQGRWRGWRGDTIRDVVNIGIGGSDLGPSMVTEALRRDAWPQLRAHFLSNVDGAHLDRVFSQCDPARTLFVVVSKTFSTTETLMNARAARAWLLASGAAESDVERHFVAVSTNIEATRAFGIAEANVFRFWDWVGGRYSLWSAVGLSIALATGMGVFRELLAGAHAMDEHFLTAPPTDNLPIMMALVGVWNRNGLDAESLCIAPYSQDLHRLPAYLQQLEMESNGKSVGRDGAPLPVASCPVIWGEPGTNGQHAFFQMLHQGTTVVPVDFIAALACADAHADQHRMLLANCFAQSEALMLGKNDSEVRAELTAQGLETSAIDALAPHKVFPGNRPSTTILLPGLNAFSLGALIALYEHKVFVQGVLWGVNSFDQWGVELGKQLARRIDQELAQGSQGAVGVPGHVDAPHDGSTRQLMALAMAAMATAPSPASAPRRF